MTNNTTNSLNHLLYHIEKELLRQVGQDKERLITCMSCDMSNKGLPCPLTSVYYLPTLNNTVLSNFPKYLLKIYCD